MVALALAVRIVVVLLGLLSIFFAGYNLHAKRYMAATMLTVGGIMIIAGQVIALLAFINPYVKG